MNLPWKRAWGTETHAAWIVFTFHKLLCRNNLLCMAQNPKTICSGHNNKEESTYWKMTNHGYEASYELEILEMVRVDVRGRVDLETVVIFTSVFEQAVHGVQNFVGQQEEPLPVRQDATEIWKWQHHVEDSLSYYIVGRLPIGAELHKQGEITQVTLQRHLRHRHQRHLWQQSWFASFLKIK